MAADEKIKWYAVYTKPRWEKKVASLLDEKNITHYCPLNKTLRQWSDRKKTVLEPLFKGYVFVQVAETKKWELLTINGIVNYVHWLGKPAIIKDEEIETIRKFLNEFESKSNKRAFVSSILERFSAISFPHSIEDVGISI